MILDPESLDRRELSGLLNGLVGPRPIAWVSTVSRDGARNLAPFSIDLGPPETPTSSLVVAGVVRIHVADEALDGLKPLPGVLRLVGRMGGDDWCRTGDRFELPRPASTDPAEVRRALERSA